MGRRTSNVMTDKQADDSLYQALEQAGYLHPKTPPSDLVTRTLRQLPQIAPAKAQRTAQKQQLWHVVTVSTAIALVLCVVFAGVWNTFGMHSPVVLTFGDGSSGISQLLLTLHLMSKPLVRSFGSLVPSLLFIGTFIAVGSAWLWWIVIQRTPVYAIAETRK